MSDSAAHAVIELAVRESYGRLVAYLAARSGDVAGAEDALSEALVAALERWTTDGLPDKPEAWLLRVARRRLIDRARHEKVRQDSEALLSQLTEDAMRVATEGGDFPDERLKLLFVCAHPAIDPSARTPLMLQAVLGIDAARIGSAFLVAPAAMGQRLVRAKAKIRAAGIPFLVPEPSEWGERLSYVLDAVYSAYTAGWESVNDTGSTLQALAAEAVALGRTLVHLMPAEPEVLGLLALMLHCEARRGARYTSDGDFVPLDQQDTSLWSRPLREEAEELLRHAGTKRSIGRYQLEAAIQSIHASRTFTGRIDWGEIALLYEGLVRVTPGLGARIGRAVALAQAGHLEEGWAAMEEIPQERVLSYQPYWAARAHLLRLMESEADAQEAFTRAASLADDPALRAYLLKRAASS